MGGFYGSSKEDAEVENLLNQLHEESVLKLKVDSHRSTSGFASGLPPSGAFHEDVAAGSGDGLDSSLLQRFDKLKQGKPTKHEKKQQQKQQQQQQQEQNQTPVLKKDAAAETGFNMSELDQRFTSLKSKQVSSKSSSFSPMKMIKQLSGGRKSFKSKSSDDSSSYSVEDGEWEHDDANKLLASVADEVKLAKQLRKASSKKGLIDSEDEEVGTKDLDLRKLKKELDHASSEEDKLAREAEEVVEWAKDAARLQADPDEDEIDHLEREAQEDVGDLDLQELLKIVQNQDEQYKKKKKPKKWGIF